MEEVIYVALALVVTGWRERYGRCSVGLEIRKAFWVL